MVARSMPETIVQGSAAPVGWRVRTVQAIASLGAKVPRHGLVLCRPQGLRRMQLSRLLARPHVIWGKVRARCVENAQLAASAEGGAHAL